MEFLTKIGAGYRTYIVAVMLVLGVVAERFLGVDIPGFDVADNWLEMVLAALGLGTLRAGIAAK